MTALAIRTNTWLTLVVTTSSCGSTPLGEMHERSDGRLAGVQVDDQHLAGDTGEHERAIDLGRAMYEDQPAMTAPYTTSGIEDHMNARALDESQLA